MSGFIELDDGEVEITVRCSEISKLIRDWDGLEGYEFYIKFYQKDYDEPIAIEIFTTEGEREARYREVMLELTGNGCALRDKLIEVYQDEIQENKGE